MSTDKQKLDELVRKVDELTLILKGISEDLKTTSASLKSLAVGQITNKPTASPLPASVAPKQAAPTIKAATPLPKAVSKPVTAPTALTKAEPSGSQEIEDVRMMFPPELDSMLAFEDKGEYVMIKPKQFLGSENFAKIASTIRGVGGEYVSAGRDSHFRVYKKKD
jgi:hypothetical protein